jgi:hypothetical protein
MGHRDVPFLAAVLQECTRRLDRLSAQNLSNVLWSCATLGHADPHMLAAWAQATINKLDSFEPQVRQGGQCGWGLAWPALHLSALVGTSQLLSVVCAFRVLPRVYLPSSGCEQ